jgi:hypothetical protein
MNLFNFLSDVVALFLMWLFIRASIHKLQVDNREYYKLLFADYGISNSNIAFVLLYLLGVVEMIIPFALLLESSRLMASIIAVLLLSTYLVGMAVQLIQGKRDMSCGCSGPNSQMKISWSLIIRNAVLVLLTLSCMLPGAGFSSQTWFATLMTSGFMILTYSCAENLIANAQKISILRAH